MWLAVPQRLRKAPNSTRKNELREACCHIELQQSGQVRRVNGHGDLTNGREPVDHDSQYLGPWWKDIGANDLLWYFHMESSSCARPTSHGREVGYLGRSGRAKIIRIRSELAPSSTSAAYFASAQKTSETRRKDETPSACRWSRKMGPRSSREVCAHEARLRYCC